mgnify:FL=1
MTAYEVQDVVCDYGVYENDELKLILNSRRIAEKIVELLKEDDRKDRELNSMPEKVKTENGYLECPYCQTDIEIDKGKSHCIVCPCQARKDT